MAGSIDRALESDTPYLDTLHILNQAEHDHHQASWTLERGQDLPRSLYQKEWLNLIYTPVPYRNSCKLCCCVC
ncbi:hypothetical protein SCLCIDRAFT_1218533 [Scleroderma citrinum Foug A]|uniref:Uncharacterized protein n=1 Tax=Scleroderma citrinum Foug A TaxID=1036808 RepID=A0A0C3DQV4_9AGAM|nr:hypothetical protein SCLCIDRAFT_1218533 [Scleroderma citrinum Foug A]